MWYMPPWVYMVVYASLYTHPGTLLPYHPGYTHHTHHASRVHAALRRGLPGWEERPPWAQEGNNAWVGGLCAELLPKGVRVDRHARARARVLPVSDWIKIG